MRTLSLEGERLLKSGDYHAAIEHFEAGLRAGTDDMESRERDQMLSAVYNQLGNACFYIHKFNKALEYHKKDLEIAQRLQDRPGQAKAYGNLGNTFKSLKKYPQAIRCCESHLEITREQKDMLGEGRACYNLGNVHHAVGKQKISTKKEEQIKAGKESIQRAIEYYKITLQITTEQGDESGEGRAVGNLGNAYTAIGLYDEAIQYHHRRLKIAEAAKDLNAKARACGNLGNAYSALHEYSEALSSYKMSLAVAKEAKNVPGMSQAYYCIGSTYGSLKNYVKAIEFHEEHLALATKMDDKSGMLRAWYNLRNVHHLMQAPEKVVYYHKLIQEHQGSRNPGGQKMNAKSSVAPDKSGARASAPVAASKAAAADERSSSSKSKRRKNSRPQAKPKSQKGPTAVMAFSAEDSSDDDDIVHHRVDEHTTKAKGPPMRVKNAAFDWLEKAITNLDDDDASAVIVDKQSYVIKNGELEDVEEMNFDSSVAGSAVTASEAAFDDMLVSQASESEQKFFDDLVAKMADTRIEAAPTASKVEITDDMSFFDMLDAAKKASSS